MVIMRSNEYSGKVSSFSRVAIPASSGKNKGASSRAPIKLI